MDMTPLIDGRVVAQTFALARDVVPPEPKGPGKVVRPGRAYGSVLRGPDGQWTMWYLAEPQYCEYVATSNDGLTWHRPELDLIWPHLREQTEGLNAFLAPHQKDAAGRWLVHEKGPEGFCVLDRMLTPHPAARCRYTAMYLARAHLDEGWVNGLHLAHSDDGVHWLADERNPVMHGWRDTANMFFYDTRLARYVWYGRPEAHVASGRHANRLIARSESEDLVHWQPERTVLDTDDLDADPLDLIDELALREGDLTDARARAAAVAKLTESENPDTGETAPCIRGRNRQWYGITVWPCGGLYLALGRMYDLPSGQLWLELLHSYDSIDWRRETSRRPFLTAPQAAMRCAMSSPPVPVGDELWIYTSTDDRNHHGRAAPGAERGIEVHALKRDRWVAYSAGPRRGELLTQPLTRGSRIALNARTSPGGCLRVGVLDAAGKPIEGLATSDCAPVTGDGLAMEPRWAGASLPLHLDMIRLRIVMEQASLFALEV